MSTTGAKIKIIAVPPGGAPEWVRKEWVGLEMPIEVPGPGLQMGVKGTAPQNLGGYHVQFDKAMAVLEGKSPKAAKWWQENVPFGFTDKDTFVFKSDVCEFIGA